nr:magnesium transporter [Chlamydiifrater phoenicopteri]
MGDLNRSDHEKVDSGSGHLMDTKTSHLDDELSFKLEKAFDHLSSTDVHSHDVAKIVAEYNPIDLAYAVSGLPSASRAILYKNLSCISSKVAFIINTDSASRWAIFRKLSDTEVCSLIEQMPPDEAVWVLDDIPDRRYRRILDLIDSKKAQKIKDLQKHGRNTAGRLMTNEFFAFPMETTLQDVSACIRNNPGIDLTRLIFVLDFKGELQGVVTDRSLIINPPEVSLKQIMHQVEHKVLPDATREEVVDIVERYKIAALPVVDEDNFLIGAITYEDVVETIEDIADETIARMAGTTEDLGYHNCHIFQRFLLRAPWLLFTLVAGLTSASAMAYFQRLAPKLLSLIMFFIPLINGMSGNVGVQCSTILVRSMATGTLPCGRRRETIFKEMGIGLLTGVILGVLCGLVVYGASFLGFFSGNNLQLGVTVATGILGASLTATTLGVLSPFFFVKIGVDPALASGPIVTALNDIMSMLMFFVITGIVNAIFFN